MSLQNYRIPRVNRDKFKATQEDRTNSPSNRMPDNYDRGDRRRGQGYFRSRYTGMRFPEGWLKYDNVGRDLEGTRFVPFKTPLKRAFFEHKDDLHPELQFDVLALVNCAARAGKVLGLVIDLTNTNRYYERSEWESHGVKYEKLNCPGHEVNEREDIVETFIEIVKNFVNDPQNDGKLIGVHCTHAISLFEYSRGHPMERSKYKKSLYEAEIRRRIRDGDEECSEAIQKLKETAEAQEDSSERPLKVEDGQMSETAHENLAEEFSTTGLGGSEHSDSPDTQVASQSEVERVDSEETDSFSVPALFCPYHKHIGKHLMPLGETEMQLHLIKCRKAYFKHHHNTELLCCPHRMCLVSPPEFALHVAMCQESILTRQDKEFIDKPIIVMQLPNNFDEMLRQQVQGDVTRARYDSDESSETHSGEDSDKDRPRRRRQYDSDEDEEGDNRSVKSSISSSSAENLDLD
ncbi:unnamed protein product [Caenorhabditis auriculariae]|uniref:Uncharacterized protein n=1 Tax=Caenorhabditis auriculariae TaxID=2777116 RepID=A0A8S1HJ85_9PELO|nr:unnamed protein product [Caenorhabditis auriculariae]